MRLQKYEAITRTVLRLTRHLSGPDREELREALASLENSCRCLFESGTWFECSYHQRFAGGPGDYVDLEPAPEGDDDLPF